MMAPPVRPAAPVAPPAVATPVASTPVAPPAPTPTPVVATPSPAAPAEPTRPALGSLSSATPSRTPFAASPAVSARPSAATPATPGKRPVNPFLANDPNLKARRLARALVSDMIAYLPDKREQGLRDGTLKALFKEEIKKSYEEYIDQIGKEFAESTTHFQEALNDLLAGGQKMF